MGIEITATEFGESDFQRFGDRLAENLVQLGQLLRTPGFGQGPASLGAELELYVVDDEGHPLHANEAIHAAASDPSLTLELNRYNLEFNLPPFAMDQGPFRRTEQAIVDSLARLAPVAAAHGGRLVPIGILPTLREQDFGPACITNRRRYHALVHQLTQRRHDEFRIDIDGDNPLQMAMADITLEGANTSFQVHYRVAPADYADTFNAIQLATPLVLALAANSPTLFGHALWHETRIPLFKQAIDTRHVDRYRWHEPARVAFGQGWVRRGAEELFREVVNVYPPLLPVCSDENAGQQLAEGRTPTLSELRLHQSTVWLWNRPVYDDAGGGHLRIEMRALPAGPSAIDMAANAALLVGLAEGLRPQLPTLLPALPFRIAEYNFYRAAQHGLAAKLVWPDPRHSGCRERAVTDILRDCLPLAQRGLESIGIGADEINRYLAVIGARLESRQNGAEWQRRRLAQLRGELAPTAALHQMLEDFIDNSHRNLPVSEWSL